MKSKGDVSFPYIIGGALAIVVLVVMIMIFTGQIGSLNKRYTEAAVPTHTAAEKTGWCIGTITQGRACGYQTDCGDIGDQLGGRGRRVDPKTEPCTGVGKLHAYSESTGQFCCVELG